MYHYSNHHAQSPNNMAFSYQNDIDYSDAESVVDSMIGHLSPNPSVENSWSSSPANTKDTWSSDQEVFCGMISDAIKSLNQSRGIHFCPDSNTTCHKPHSGKYSGPTSIVPFRMTNSSNRESPGNGFEVPNMIQSSGIFNTQFTQDLDSYLDSSINNLEDLKNLSIEELLHDTLDIGFNSPPRIQHQQSALQGSDSNIFNLNRSTMDNKRQEHFLQMIKQQNNQSTSSNQSSPPATPSSEWSDIPSPVSSTGDFEVPSLSKPVYDKPVPIKQKRTRRQYSTNTGKPRLYKFLLEILNDPKTYHCIEWVDKTSGTFKFLDSSEVARLWGFRKNKPAMKYENFARSLRTYIAKGILKKPRNKLVYCFACPESD